MKNNKKIGFQFCIKSKIPEVVKPQFVNYILLIDKNSIKTIFKIVHV